MSSVYLIKTITWLVAIYNLKKYILSSQCNLTAQIEPVQDKLHFDCLNITAV